jgi:pyrimidine operon attenuation protein/uracil phosphoribosyltransferase
VDLARHHQELEARDERQAIDVMQQLRAINAACLEVLSKARAAENHSTLLRAVDRIHRQIELQARLLGEIQDGQTVNVLVAPEWHQVRLVVVEALRPFPEARTAVSRALTALPGAGGGDRGR